MTETGNTNSDAFGAPGIRAFLCFYVAYQTPAGVSWRIIETPLDLDKAQDLRRWIEEEEINRRMNIAPIFWKRLEV